jgi:beta-lactamase regulating signal transducer with metallopeptidase domain
MSLLTSLVGALGAWPIAAITKVTAILLAVCAAALILTRPPFRASAAVRHMVWLASLVACLAVSLLSPFVPVIAVAVSSRPDLPIARYARDDNAVATVANLPSAPSTPRSTVAPPGASTSRHSFLAWLRDHALPIMLVAWALGCVLVVARCLVGHLLVARLVRRSRSLVKGAADAEARRRVRVLTSDTLAAPITLGWAKPVILLPAEARDWSSERRRLVLAHELAHIERGDYVAQLVATAASALLWFHPLVWLAAARLRTEAEHAADDQVLACGASGIVYATHLLEIAGATGALHLSATVAVGMARTPRIEGRIRALLDDRQPRRSIAARTMMIATVIAAGIMVPLAGLRTVVRAAPVHSVARQRSTSTGSPAPKPRGNIATSTPVERPLEHHRTDSIVDREIDAVRGAQLVASLRTGGSVVVRGWDSARVRVHAELGGRDWRSAVISLEHAGDDARLSSMFADGATHDFQMSIDIWVPRKTDLDLTSAGGSVDIRNIDGKFTGQTGGGDVSIRNANGSAQFSTGGGDIDVYDSQLSGRVSTGWGRIKLHDVTGDLRGVANSSSNESSQHVGIGIGAGSGSGYDWQTGRSATRTTSVTNTNATSGGCVAVSVGSTGTQTGFWISRNSSDAGPIHATGPLSIHRAAGNIEIASAPEGATLSTGGGSIMVDESSKAVVASTGGGLISLARTKGDATVSIGAGEVTIGVINAGTTSHTINVCNGQGKVILELPADLDATFELETAYTDKFDRRTTISSDFPLEQSETQTWDDRFGAPRKFVRAAGKAGNGSGLIRVNTVNGDIIVRRR